MAFDAGFLAAVAAEIKNIALGGRVEKVYQPEKDTVILQMRTFEGGGRLLINAGSSNPRVGFTQIPYENPQNPPQFCVLLRKHLSGGKLTDVRQIGFERVLVLEFETRDEMGYLCTRRLVIEVMGKYSNLIFTDGEEKVLAVLRPVDFTTSSKRQVLPGMRYEMPPAQSKIDPRECPAARFWELMTEAGDLPVEKWITKTFLGVSAVVAREMAGTCVEKSVAALSKSEKQHVFDLFSGIYAFLEMNESIPCIGYDDMGKPVEYSFTTLYQYEHRRSFESPSALLDEWFGGRDKEARVKQRAADVLRLLTNARNRILHKLELQRGELAACERGAEYKRAGDLITANCYQLERGMTRARLIDYNDYREDGTFGEVEVELDSRLTPAANAQRYFKKYAKSKTAKVELTKQIAQGEAELAYLESVQTALNTAESPTDLLEIREELYRAGYASRGKQNQMGSRKQGAPGYAEYRTTNGYRVLCGKNNLQNEYITHKIAERSDFWFHAKNMPGSHVVMLLEGKEEPPAEDFTEAASIAALFSAAEGAPMTEVDYTTVRQLKKAPGGKPGFVIYHTNWSAIVTPDKEKIAKMRVK
ncbi:MAG: fibronectin/fibrinogen-binding protein [Ruminococcaceae bacterium]|nr:fibronectin/fibrinogen-binding protein [Oscillospiraceae bacterium]